MLIKSSPQFLYSLSTLVALIAFAGNSVLCRLALQEQSIDATSFTIIRLLSGAISLVIIVKVLNLLQNSRLKQQCKNTALLAQQKSRGSWIAAFMLFLYAVCFSYAYIMLDAGLGALILFGCVQLSMITVSIIQKQPLSLIKWLGLIGAFSGLIYLVNSQNELSGLNHEVNFSFLGFLLMLVSGIAWASYTILGKGSATPLIDTKINFTKSLVFVIPLTVVYFVVESQVTLLGIGLSIASGMLTSGIGYAIWYYALNGLSPVQAGVVQLMVPVIAAFGGILWIGEAITVELMLAQAIILGGIALVMFSPSKSD